MDDTAKLANDELRCIGDILTGNVFTKLIVALDGELGNSKSSEKRLSLPASFVWEHIVHPLVPDRPSLSNYYDFWRHMHSRDDWSRSRVNAALASISSSFRLDTRAVDSDYARQKATAHNVEKEKQHALWESQKQALFAKNAEEELGRQREKDEMFAKQRVLDEEYRHEMEAAKRQRDRITVQTNVPSNTDKFSEAELTDLGTCIHGDDFTRVVSELEAYEIWQQVQPQRDPTLQNRTDFWRRFQLLSEPINRAFINRSLQRAYCEYRVKGAK